MTIFNLLTFPNVCRACLQSLHPDQMVPLDTLRPLFEGDIRSFLQEITFEIPKPLLPYLPTAVCYTCLEVMEFYFKYRKKMSLLHRFQVALGRVKLGDETCLRELFETDPEKLEVLFHDLDLSNMMNAKADDLLEEYQQYMIASMSEENKDAKDKPVSELTTMEQKEEVSETASDTVACEEAPCEEGTEQASESSDPVEEMAGTSFKATTKPEIKRLQRSAVRPMKRIPRRRRKLSHSTESKTEQLGNEHVEDGDTEEDLDQKPTARGRRTRTKLYRPNEAVQLHRCKLCSYKTFYTVVYELHLQKHDANKDKKGHICPHPYCLQVFGTKEALKQHTADNTPHKYICEMCGTLLKYRASFDAHMERHVGITHFQCSYCSSTFITQSEVAAHLAAVHLSEQREKCQHCGAQFTSKKHLNQHLQSHSTERKHRCTACEASFKSQHHLHRHIQTVHQVVRYNCDHCDMSYGRRDKLRLHLERVHLIQSYFVCNICVRSFDTKDALQEHSLRHANPKDLECGTCLVVCRSQESFENHVCISYQDDYVCCERDFKNHLRYNRHMASHGVTINARVRPDGNLLIGQARIKRDSCRRSAANHDTTEAKKAAEMNLHTEFGCLYCGQCLLSEESLVQHVCEIFSGECNTEDPEMVDLCAEFE